METNSPHNPKFDDFAYIVSVLTGPLTVLVAAIIALAASTNLVAQDRAKDLSQFAIMLLTGGAAVTGTTQPRRSGTTNVAMGREVNVGVEAQPDTSNKSNSAIVQQKETPLNVIKYQPPKEPSIESEQAPAETTLNTSVNYSTQVSVPP